MEQSKQRVVGLDVHLDFPREARPLPNLTRLPVLVRRLRLGRLKFLFHQIALIKWCCAPPRSQARIGVRAAGIQLQRAKRKRKRFQEPITLLFQPKPMN